MPPKTKPEEIACTSFDEIVEKIAQTDEEKIYPLDDIYRLRIGWYLPKSNVRLMMNLTSVKLSCMSLPAPTSKMIEYSLASEEGRITFALFLMEHARQRRCENLQKEKEKVVRVKSRWEFL